MAMPAVAFKAHLPLRRSAQLVMLQFTCNRIKGIRHARINRRRATP
jgi:hypothetical protein